MCVSPIAGIYLIIDERVELENFGDDHNVLSSVETARIGLRARKRADGGYCQEGKANKAVTKID